MVIFSSKIVMVAFIWIVSRPRGWRSLWKWPAYLLLTPYIAVRYRNALPDAMEKVSEEMIRYRYPGAKGICSFEMDICMDDSSDDVIVFDEVCYSLGSSVDTEEPMPYPVRFVDGVSWWENSCTTMRSMISVISPSISTEAEKSTRPIQKLNAALPTCPV
jgi:hypothetical protein